MTGPTNNWANGSVGAQTGDVGGDVTVNMWADLDPAAKYTTGVGYLSNGMAGLARRLIGEAIAGGRDSTEVRFYWLLAMVSDRTDRQFTDDDWRQLKAAAGALRQWPADQWTQGIEVIHQLLAVAAQPDSSPDDAIKALKALDRVQREAIEQHLDRYLIGTARTSWWTEERDHALRDRLANERTKRVRYFFMADPIGARVAPPRPPSTTPREHAQAVVAGMVCGLALAWSGWLVIGHGWWPGILGYAALLAGGGAAVWHGLDWRYRAQRLRTEDAAHHWQPKRTAPPGAGFTARIDELLDQWFARSVPDHVDRDQWIETTMGLRNRFREELVSVYRESRVAKERIEWLVRYLVEDVRRRWSDGTLWNYRVRYRTPWRTVAACCGGTVVAVAGSVATVVAAVLASPVAGVVVGILLLASGPLATKRITRIIIEQRRRDEEKRECAERLAQRTTAFQQWQNKLRRLRPKDHEMARWLHCDRILLLDQAMNTRNLRNEDLMLYTFLETPTPRCRRSRRNGGPWRYSRYAFRLFLITKRGVWLQTSTLATATGTVTHASRTSFDFNSISSVDVALTSGLPSTFALRLVGGEKVVVDVVSDTIDPKDLPEPSAEGTPRPAQDQPSTTIPNRDAPDPLTLEASGLPYTLNMLEGIAAEGDRWLRRQHSYTARLVKEIASLLA